LDEEPKKNLPVKKFKAGQVSATIWKAKNEGKAFLIVFEKAYKGKDDKWVSTNHYTPGDLPTLAWLARKAFDYITK